MNARELLDQERRPPRRFLKVIYNEVYGLDLPIVTPPPAERRLLPAASASGGECLAHPNLRVLALSLPPYSAKRFIPRVFAVKPCDGKPVIDFVVTQVPCPASLVPCEAVVVDLHLLRGESLPLAAIVPATSPRSERPAASRTPGAR